MDGQEIVGRLITPALPLLRNDVCERRRCALVAGRSLSIASWGLTKYRRQVRELANSCGLADQPGRKSSSAASQFSRPSIPVPWVTVDSETWIPRRGNTFEPNGLSIGSNRPHRSLGLRPSNGPQLNPETTAIRSMFDGVIGLATCCTSTSAPRRRDRVNAPPRQPRRRQARPVYRPALPSSRYFFMF